MDGGGIGRSIIRGAGFAIGVGLVLVVAVVARAAISVLVLVFVAVILAAGLQPIVAEIRSHIRVGRGPAILLVYGAFLLVVVGLVLVVVPVAFTEFDRTLRALPPFFERAKTWAETLRPVGLSQNVVALINSVSRTLQPAAPPAPGEVVQVGLTVAEAITSVLTLLTVVYFWLTEHARLQRYVLAFVPADRRARARDVWNSAETRLGMWVRGQLILMASIGIAAGIAYTVLGVPAGLLLGLFAAIAEGIPIVGPLIGAIPAVLVAATVSPQLALIVAGVYAVLQILEGNVLVPIVMRNTVGISPFLVILSVLIGAAAGGFVGALLAVPIAATCEILIEGLQAREVPVAQDATAIDTSDDTANAPDVPDQDPPSSFQANPVR